ncbi:MAG: hypothetical protein IPI11_18640 [Haliscomenobacter sp.]|nr:hypothetical protein [Haliscomenobacter sp.]
MEEKDPPRTEAASENPTPQPEENTAPTAPQPQPKPKRIDKKAPKKEFEKLSKQLKKAKRAFSKIKKAYKDLKARKGKEKAKAKLGEKLEQAMSLRKSAKEAFQSAQKGKEKAA